MSPGRIFVRAPRVPGEPVGARLRAGWKFAILVALYLAFGFLVARGVDATGVKFGRGFTAGFGVISEALQFLVALAASWTLARIEGRSLAAYGLPRRGAFGGAFWVGTLWGLVAVTALFAMVLVAGGARVTGLAIHGAELLEHFVLWALVFVLVGLYEELLFRGTPLFTLAGGMGFWPGAVALSLFFGALHYFGKPMENLSDLASVTLLGLFLCLALRRTGSLWWAIGFHFGFDWAALYAYGAPNTANDGKPLVGRLLAVDWQGPAWMTGGPLGLEASAFVFVVIAALYWLFLRRYPQTRWPAA